MLIYGLLLLLLLVYFVAVLTLLLTQSPSKVPIFNAYISWQSSFCIASIDCNLFRAIKVIFTQHYFPARGSHVALFLRSHSVLASPCLLFLGAPYSKTQLSADCLNRCLIVRQAVCLRLLMLRLALCTRCTTFNDYHIWRIRNSGQKREKKATAKSK